MPGLGFERLFSRTVTKILPKDEASELNGYLFCILPSIKSKQITLAAGQSGSQARGVNRLDAGPDLKGPTRPGGISTRKTPQFNSSVAMPLEHIPISKHDVGSSVKPAKSGCARGILACGKERFVHIWANASCIDFKPFASTCSMSSFQ